MPSKAIFLDRDGVLIKDKNLLTKLDDMEILPSVSEALTLFKELGYELFVITNQSVVARGLLTLREAQELNQDILKAIGLSFFTESFLCPHHPKANVIEYRLDCECRKPKAGMILEARKKYDVDLSQSIVIGDRPSDVYAGKSVGCRGFLLKTGEHESPLIETSLDLRPEWLRPDHTFTSLIEVAHFLKENA